MFGFRVRFNVERMKDFEPTEQERQESAGEEQTYKPIHFYAKDRCQMVVQRYARLTGFHSK